MALILSLRMELKNGVCIVTGSATGIGAACAIQLAQRGCRTVINYTRSEAEARATARLCEQYGTEALLVRANVADDADCRRMADAALAKWGEEHGALAESLSLATSVFDDRIEQQTAFVRRLVPPVTMVVVASIALMVVLSLMIPLVKLIEGLSG